VDLEEIMKVIVTGGAGFIGSNLVDLLLDCHHDVVVIDNLSSGFQRNISTKAKFYLADIKDKEVIETIFSLEKPDIVFHLAAQIDVRQSIENPLLDASTNIIGGINVLEASRIHKTKKIIYANSVALYGTVPFSELPIQETSLAQPDSPYGASKHTFEHYLSIYEKLFGLRYTILRFANVYGDRQNIEGEGGVIALFFGKLLKKKSPTVYGTGLQTRDYIYVKDITKACISAINVGDSHCFNIGTQKETSVIELLEKMQKICKTDLKPIFVNARPGEIERSVLNTWKAEELLGWKPSYTLESGLTSTFDYFFTK
jgi:UDP-glucose 4-epimerase